MIGGAGPENYMKIEIVAVETEFEFEPVAAPATGLVIEFAVMAACEAVATDYFAVADSENAAAGSDDLPVQTHEMKLGSDFAAAAVVANLNHSKWNYCYCYY